MDNLKQRQGAKRFVEKWQGPLRERAEYQKFWISLLSEVFGVERPDEKLVFEEPVYYRDGKGKPLGFIDVRIPSTRVLIEQKGCGHPLDVALKQSDGTMLTPFQQGKRYADNMRASERPRWIVACNFETFEIHDLDNPDPKAPPEIVKLADLGKEFYRLNFLVDEHDANTKREENLSMSAGELVGKLYDGLLKQYKNPDDPEVQRSLNVLCVRLVFCLYAEDAGLFNSKRQFHDYLRDKEPGYIRDSLKALFKILDTKEPERDPDENVELLDFPYVNGGLFSDQTIRIPQFTAELKEMLLSEASEGFDWSAISPTIFGAVFESTLNPETRNDSSMHYTSVANINKVIDPLFMNNLEAEFKAIVQIKQEKKRNLELDRFQTKLGSLKFLDPACGSGNFLTETFIRLRRLENKVIEKKLKGMGTIDENVVKVSIKQFYGIEINDFAVAVAQVALWIAESQMLSETQDLLGIAFDFFPLKTNVNIHEGNALRMNWTDVIPISELSYIMGNPPFKGHNKRSDSQKEDLSLVFGNISIDKSDYVIAWLYLAAKIVKDSKVRAGFVATNSICQGPSVGIIWKEIFSLGVHIDFAYRSFVWDSEATEKAHVHVVIVGFSSQPVRPKFIFDHEQCREAENINGYLLNAPDVCVSRRTTPLCEVPEMRVGSLPRSSGFTVTPAERSAMIKKSPICEKWIRPYIGSDEFLKNSERYCLWLKGADAAEVRQCPDVKARVEQVRQDRLSSTAEGTRKKADTPMLFAVDAQPATTYLAVPQVSSEQRNYLPMGFVEPMTIASNLLFIIPNADHYHFGVLMSSVHMDWMRLVSGRLETRYRYSQDCAYNCFVWPEVTEDQRKKITQTAEAILKARTESKGASLADLYDNDDMPAELRNAHRANDKAVLEAYGLSKDATEEEIVEHLIKLYCAKLDEVTRKEEEEAARIKAEKLAERERLKAERAAERAAKKAAEKAEKAKKKAEEKAAKAKLKAEEKAAKAKQKAKS